MTTAPSHETGPDRSNLAGAVGRLRSDFILGSTRMPLKLT